MVSAIRSLLLTCALVFVSLTDGLAQPVSEVVTWTSAANVTATAGSIEKIGGCNMCDDAGAISAQRITSGDGYVEFMFPTEDKTAFAGLSSGNTDTGPGDIDFALKFNPFKPGTQRVVWKDPVNVTATANSIEKTGGCSPCDDAGAISEQRITTGDGYVEFTIPLTTKTVFAGLSRGDTDTSPGDIDFALKFVPGGIVEVRENNISQAQTTFAANDVFRVAVVAGTVQYSRNGVLFFTSAKLPKYPLLLDTSLQDLDAKIVNAVISGALNRGVVEVRENNVFRAETIYSGGDVFRIAVGGGRVQYSRQGVAFYTSANLPRYPLLLDTSLQDLNVKIVNAVISGALSGSNRCPVPAPLAAFSGSTQFNNTVRAQMWLDLTKTWWGAFSDDSTGIYFYTLSGDTWVKGDFIDANFAAGQPDTLSNGPELFILAYQSGSLARLYKYAYLGTTYLLARGFPVDLPLAGLANSIALHQDSTGKLWATYTSGTNVHVIWSTSLNHRKWNTEGMILASDIADFTTEAATIAHFGGDRIGVVWGNQARDEIAFRFHRDGDPETSWSQKETIDCCQGFLDAEGELTGIVSDDHLSLRAAPDGRLFLVAKDGFEGPGGFLEGRLHLYVRGVNGRWEPKTLVHPDPNGAPTRPVLVLDVENHRAEVIYRNSVDDNRVYFSRAGMDLPEFNALCVFLEPPFSLTGSPTNMTSTKQNVDGIADLVAAASRQGQIFSARLDLESAVGQIPLAPVSAAPTPAPDVGTAIADFEAIWEGLLSTSTVPLDLGQWRWLRGQGVNTIVNLDGGMFDFGQFGFESFLWVPLGADATPTAAEASRFLKFIQRRDNQPAHISSAASGRGATMVALLRYAIDGWTLESALAEALRLTQGAPLSLSQTQFLQGWTGTHLPGSHRLSWGSTGEDSTLLSVTTSALDSTLSTTTSTVDSTVSSTTSTVDSTTSTTTSTLNSTVDSTVNSISTGEGLGGL